MAKGCDNLSVGVIVEQDGHVAMLKRTKVPIGIDPPCGHIDDHGSPERAAVYKAYEELGLQVSLRGLVQTVIADRYVVNPCTRPGGDYHTWWVYEAREFTGELSPHTDEGTTAEWYSPDQLQDLADRTRLFQIGQLTVEDWQRDPGLGDVWVGFMTELGYVE